MQEMLASRANTLIDFVIPTAPVLHRNLQWPLWSSRKRLLLAICSAVDGHARPFVAYIPIVYYVSITLNTHEILCLATFGTVFQKPSSISCRFVFNGESGILSRFIFRQVSYPGLAVHMF